MNGLAVAFRGPDDNLHRELAPGKSGNNSLDVPIGKRDLLELRIAICALPILLRRPGEPSGLDEVDLVSDL